MNPVEIDDLICMTFADNSMPISLAPGYSVRAARVDSLPVLPEARRRGPHDFHVPRLHMPRHRDRQTSAFMLNFERIPSMRKRPNCLAGMVSKSNETGNGKEWLQRLEIRYDIQQKTDACCASA